MVHSAKRETDALRTAGEGGKQVRRERMREAVAYLQRYIETYDIQFGYQDYSDETFIDDILYGLGVSLGDEHKFAVGFALFKQKLRDHLGSP